MAEQWLPVPGYEGIYEVSDQGRVRSLARTITTKRGDPKRYKPRVLKSAKNSTRRWAVGLSRDAKTESKLVHRLVAEAFLSNPEGHPLVRHLDDNPDNNHAANLAWGTYSDNQHDRVRNGIYRNGMTEWTHCRAGHEYTEDNIYRVKSRPNQRLCRTCTLARGEKYRSQKR